MSVERPRCDFARMGGRVTSTLVQPLRSSCQTRAQVLYASIGVPGKSNGSTGTVLLLPLQVGAGHGFAYGGAHLCFADMCEGGPGNAWKHGDGSLASVTSWGRVLGLLVGRRTSASQICAG